MKEDKERRSNPRYKFLIYIQFDHSAKQYSFGARTDYHKGQKVVVETVRGKELGTVCAPSVPFDPQKTKGDIRPVIRLATKYDEIQKVENEEAAEKAIKICRQCIENLDLDMHLINGEYSSYVYEKRLIGLYKREAALFLFLNDDLDDEFWKQDLKHFYETKIGKHLIKNLKLEDKVSNIEAPEAVSADGE